MIRKCKKCGYWFIKSRNHAIVDKYTNCPNCSEWEIYSEFEIIKNRFYDWIERKLNKVKETKNEDKKAIHTSVPGCPTDRKNK